MQAQQQNKRERQEEPHRSKFDQKKNNPLHTETTEIQRHEPANIVEFSSESAELMHNPHQQRIDRNSGQALDKTRPSRIYHTFEDDSMIKSALAGKRDINMDDITRIARGVRRSQEQDDIRGQDSVLNDSRIRTS